MLKVNVDFDQIEETAMALAQGTIGCAMREYGISNSELARRMRVHRSAITRMLSGNHNLTIKTFALALAACGDDFTIVRKYCHAYAKTTDPASCPNRGESKPVRRAPKEPKRRGK
jgi:transcriptional regulator with XRE-family HTH domain